MKKLSNLKGAQILSSTQQKRIKGGGWQSTGVACVMYCPELNYLINICTAFELPNCG